MLDLKFIRENPDIVRQAVANRQDTAPLDEILELDLERRQKLLELEGFRHVRKEAGKARGAARQNAEEGRRLRAKIRALEEEVRGLDEQMEVLLLQVPNIPNPVVPVGMDEEDDVTVRSWGELKDFGFEPAPHWKLGESLGIIDFERGVRMSGSRFYVLKGVGARLQRALIAFMLDFHTAHGYQEIYPPFMVRQECMVGSGNLPKFADNLYHDEEDGFGFIPTAEVPLTNLHRDEIISPGVLPLYYVAYTACFRREKMSAGKDTRGIKRGHQFDKVEMYKFTEADTSDDELEKLLSDAEDVCQRLGLPYRTVTLCTGDLEVTLRALTKLALGSRKLYDELNVEAFVEQYDEAKTTVGRFSEVFASHPWLPKRVLALRQFGDSELFRRRSGRGDGGLSMEQVDEQVHQIIKVVG